MDNRWLKSKFKILPHQICTRLQMATTLFSHLNTSQILLTAHNDVSNLNKPDIQKADALMYVGSADEMLFATPSQNDNGAFNLEVDKRNSCARHLIYLAR
jgi:hypothetical protein